MPPSSAADLRITTAREYREAVAEVQRLETAREGSPEFERRQALRAALHEYELTHLRPEYRRARPPGTG